MLPEQEDNNPGRCAAQMGSVKFSRSKHKPPTLQTAGRPKQISDPFRYHGFNERVEVSCQWFNLDEVVK